VLDVVLTVVALAVGLAAAWWALRQEPHWASRDGRRMTARMQPLVRGDSTGGRWREVRARVDDDGSLVTRARGLPTGRLNGQWTIVNASLDASGKRALYVARRAQSAGPDAEEVVVRIPASSRARPVLDGLADGRQRPSAP